MLLTLQSAGSLVPVTSHQAAVDMAPDEGSQGTLQGLGPW